MSAVEEKQRLSGDAPRHDSGSSSSVLPTVNPSTEKPEPPKSTLHPAFYITTWIAMSSATILFNKQILDKLNFPYPIILTTWHLAFGTFMTQVLARTTTLLDGRKKVKMTGRVYLRAIVPIGFFFSLSLICGNVTYLYLSVSFIQMLKATTPAAVLFCSWVFGLESPNFRRFLNVMWIVTGVMIASYGEIEFKWIGFLYQLGGVIFEAIRLTMVGRLLSSAEFKMDPLVSFYYFAPVCAIMNGLVSLVAEVPRITLAEVAHVGYFTLLANAMIAFGLNVSVVFLIGRTSVLIMTLCGVLKDILLVCASIAIWGTPVTLTQFFGYGLALAGMIYFKLGADNIKNAFAEGGRQWATYGNNHPAQRKIVVFLIVILILFLLMTGLAPTLGYETSGILRSAKEWFGGILGNGRTGN